MNIVQAIKDPNLFRPFLQDKDGKISSWLNWLTALRVLYGLPIRKTSSKELVMTCTGREASLLPLEGFSSALFLTGRRSGKSRIAAIIGGFESVLAGRERLLSKGEQGLIAVLAPTVKQSRIVRLYLRAIFNETPMLHNEIVDESKEGFTLKNGVRIEVLAGDWRSIRGYSLLAAIVDEVCFFGLDADSHVLNDTELINAIRPALATTGGKLICISSPYARKGWAFNQWKKYFGNDLAKTLIWNSPSRAMNPTLPQSVVDQAMEEDLAAAKAEYLGEFRDDIAAFLPREVIETAVIKGRTELPYQRDTNYYAFADVSGGRSDDASLAIGHQSKEKKAVVDLIRRYKAPHSPYQIITLMSDELRRFQLRSVKGDNYSAEFVKEAFRTNGIHYEKAELPKSRLYIEFLPLIGSGLVELLDNEVLINQIAGLERRTRSGGHDIVDHGPNGHDDVANAVSGVCTTISKRKIVLGPIGGSPNINEVSLRCLSRY